MRYFLQGINKNMMNINLHIWQESFTPDIMGKDLRAYVSPRNTGGLG